MYKWKKPITPLSKFLQTTFANYLSDDILNIISINLLQYELLYKYSYGISKSNYSLISKPIFTKPKYWEYLNINNRRNNIHPGIYA